MQLALKIMDMNWQKLGVTSYTQNCKRNSSSKL